MSEGESAGLDSVAYMTQGDYLKGLGLESMMERVRRLELPLRERTANLKAMRELADAEGFGKFRVLVQSKGISGLTVESLLPSKPLPKDVAPPLKAEHHMLTTEGTYPRSGFTLDVLWPDVDE